VPTSLGGHGSPPCYIISMKFNMRCQNICTRYNLVINVLILVLVLEIRILWVARNEYEHEDDDEVLAL
jgi:hypothetical protein